jgi:Tfp pilus assembly protein PilW
MMNRYYDAFKAVTTCNRDIRHAGYTPDINPKTKQVSKAIPNTVKFKDNNKFGTG